jgi:HK97 gp10 family phage protein
MPTDDFAELRTQLDALKHDALNKAERKALRQVGELITTAIVEVCPVQAGVAEGLLEPEQLKESFRPVVHIASDEKIASGDTSRVTIQPNTKLTRDVAKWVEDGHAGPKPSSKRTKPHPFVRPAADSVEQKAIDTYTSVMTEEITKALK